jgi:chromate transporter
VIGAVPFREAHALWMRIGVLSVGGPAAQIALLHRLLVTERQWINAEEFNRALGFCTLLPGPEAQQLATYCGWRLHGVRGGLAAGLWFIAPGLLLITALAAVALTYGAAPMLEGALYALTGVTIALVALALVHVARRWLRDAPSTTLALASFVAMWGQLVPFPWLIAAGAIVGVAMPASRAAGQAASMPRAATSASASAMSNTPTARRTLTTAALWLAVWLVPIALLPLPLGSSPVFGELGAFFSRVAAFTFGGAYSILGYVATESVAQQWVTAQQMTQGLALAETTPGPLLLVLSYIGFVGAHGDPGGLQPLLAGVLGALVVAWATFAPSFLWIFAGAPWIDRLAGSDVMRRATAAISAVALGAIAKLALWFVVHALFRDQLIVEWSGGRWLVPVIESLQITLLMVALLSSALLLTKRVPTIALILGAALCGALVAQAV